MKPITSAAIATLLAVSAVAQNQIPIPPHASVYNGLSRGFNYTSPTPHIIVGLGLPYDARQSGDTASYLVRVNGIVALYSTGNTGSITTGLVVATGDVVDIIGNWSPAVPGYSTAHNSYGSSAPYASSVNGVPVTLNRTGWQWDIGDPAYINGTYVTPTTGSIGRVFVTTSCARFVPDSAPTTGVASMIPFGAPVPSTLSSVFGSNNSGNSGGAVYFDITPATNLYLHGLEVNTSALVGSAITLDVYTRSGTCSGFEGSAAGWTARTAGHGVSAGFDQPSHVDFNAGLYLAAGLTHGVAVVARDFAHCYTIGSGTYANADLTWTTGSATNTPFTGSLFSPRTVNATLIYHRDDAGWHNQIMQLVLRQSDLGGAGNITGLAFAPTSSGRHYNRCLTIRMTHKPAGYVLATTFATNITNATTVLDKVDYVWHNTADHWNEIGLTQPFAYDGSADVVVEILARGNHQQTGSLGNFRRGTRPWLYAVGWPWTSQPATGTPGNTATKIRANFSCAEAGMFGTSCGPIRAEPFGTPVLGRTFRFDIHGAVPNSGACVGLGFNSSFPYPLSLNSYGFPNCYQWNDLVATNFVVVPSSGHSWSSISIPVNLAFDGVMIFGQWFNLDTTQPGGVTVSNYIRMMIGQQDP
ncbi:MAG: hypothetical protein FJ265_01265 [Planctomycetes bacterium]|nr:hypothetical protein [Planctomycetota bacterium]